MGQILHYLGLRFLWDGAWLTVKIAAAGMIGGILLGVVLAVMQSSPLRLVRGVAKGYVWLVRGTPLLLQLVFLYDGLPTWGVKFGAVTTAVLGFALNEASYEAEIFRGGLLSVDRGQTLAAESLGMGPGLTLLRIRLPQTLRNIAPTLGNQTIGMIKSTSLASVIAVNELTLRSQQIVAQNFEFVSVFAASAVMYLVLTTIVSVLQSQVERKLSLDRVRRSRVRSLWLPFLKRIRLVRPASSGELAAMPADDAGALVCVGVTKSYGGVPVLEGIDLTIAPGEVVVIMGPSGTGKSTLARLVARLETVDGGEIRIGGELVGYKREADGAIRPLQRGLARSRALSGVAMVFQSFNLFAHKTVLENVMEAPMWVQGTPAGMARERAEAMLSRVGLADRMDYLPHLLSGGQQQRVAIARGLAMRPRLMIFDEPTSALDAELVGEVVDVVRGLARDGMTMMIVTHEIRFARTIADRVIFMADGQIVEQGMPDVLLRRPTHVRTRQFLARILAEDASETQQQPMGGGG